MNNESRIMNTKFQNGFRSLDIGTPKGSFWDLGIICNL